MLVLKLIYGILKKHFSIAGSDPRTKHFPLVSSYNSVFLLCAAYVLFSVKIGPALMAKRQPFQLKGPIKIYNIVQILLNLYIFFGLATSYWYHPKYNWFCMANDYSDTSPETLKLIHVTYVCYISKVMDLLDTIFFVLRKKNNQISFLHVYHHAAMVWGGFIYHNEFVATVFTSVAFVNCFVHVLMYTYYLVSASNMKINLDKWKPRMTQIQIIQFGYFSIKVAFVFFNNTCGLPVFWLGVVFIQNLFVALMFTNFYYKTFIVKQRRIKST